MTDRLRKTYLPFEVSFEKPQEKPKKVTKKELARLAKEAGEKHFYADCKKHGKDVKFFTNGIRCSICYSEYKKRYYVENKGHFSEYHKKYRKDNKDLLSEYKKRYYEESKICILESQKKYREENKKLISERNSMWRKNNKALLSKRMKNYYEKNRDYISKRMKKYREENKDILLERSREYRKKNAAYIFARSVLARLDSDKQETFSGITKVEAEALCGYSQVEFILHIESTFKEGMSWENRSEWHIDHILPVAWFREQGITDIKVINALSNLRAEWASDNISKGRNFLEEDLTEEEFLEIIMNEVDNGKDF